MKTIIAGSRNIDDHLQVATAIRESGIHITEVVCGMAKGVDLLGKEWADMHGIPVTCFPADWKKHGRSAGIIRNKAMAEYADTLIAIWDGKSRGTQNMITEARSRGLKVFVMMVKEEV